MMYDWKEFIKDGVIQQSINGFGPNYSMVSIVPNDLNGVDIVIGADFHHRCASGFSKEGLRSLIGLLLNIHEAME